MMQQAQQQAIMNQQMAVGQPPGPPPTGNPPTGNPPPSAP